MQIWGGSGNDTINGFSSISYSDTISGGGGSDQINGMAKDDTLSGDAGNDALTGYTGNDTLLFKYNANEGSGRIQDYTDSSGKIRFASGAGFGDLVLTGIGADCRTHLPSGGSILLVSVSSAVLDAGDFIFS